MTLCFECLPKIAIPMANQFYRSQASRMKARSRHQVLVLRDTEIKAALCLQPIADGTWLTNLLIATDQRGRGLATQLLAEARSVTQGPIWLFARPELEGFYVQRGYQSRPVLPAELADRLVRYQRTKQLVALVQPG
ncbi:GNAT family N-acetyltransferase [Pseudomonas saliphila]|uniref:GNAT family N-acetyltransferase n=1 Tax=Pseudomonas saliphila TaxID=2586906 RepID=UPI001F2A560F|nr:GNAT family N-acetyltransferase [Pseudomonas saliphila]